MAEHPYITVGSPARIQIPAGFDAKLVGQLLTSLQKWEGAWPVFADEASLRIALDHVKSGPKCAQVGAFTERDPDLSVVFLRHVPEQYWDKATNQNRPMTAIFALVRGVSSKRKPPGSIDLVPDIDCLTEAEFDALYAALVSDTRELRIRSRSVASRIAARVASEEQLFQLWLRVDVVGWHLLLALDDAQVLQLERFTLEGERAYRATGAYVGHHRNSSVLFEALRRGLVSERMLEDELQVMDMPRQGHDQVDKFLSVPAGGPEQDLDLSERLRAIIDAARNNDAIRSRIGTWFRERRQTAWPALLGDSSVLWLFAFTYDGADAAWYCDLLATGTRELAESHRCQAFASALADALVLRDDAEAIIDALRDAATAPKVAQVIEQASARLANHRALLGQATESIVWAHTHRRDALPMLHSFHEPLRCIDEGLASSDPIAVLHAFSAAAQFAADRRDLEWTIEFVRKAVHALDRVIGPNAPNAKTLTEQIGRGEILRPDGVFLRSYDTFDRVLPHPLGRDVIVPLYRTTTNAYFRTWLEEIVKDLQPEIVESLPDQLTRLARAVAADPGPKLTRHIVLRGAESPGASLVNRLYGPPIGVSIEAHPTFEGQPMAHLITLETRLLSPEAQRALGDAAAVAVFVSSLDSHQAYEPGSGHAEVVPLSQADLERGAELVRSSQPTLAGVALEVHSFDVPADLFSGDEVAGELGVLRQLLERGAFLRPHRGEPRWIQAPEHDGTFLFDLDATIAAELNLGDRGRLFVFDDAAFAQCA